MDEKIVAQLSNDTDTKLVDVNVVERLIKTNSDLIDGYLRGRYPLPLKQEHSIIKQTTIDLVKFDLYKRREQTTETMQKHRRELTDILINIQKGVITLDEGSPETRPSAVSFTKQKSVFGNILKQYRNL